MRTRDAHREDVDHLGTPATGSTLSDAIPANDRRASCPSTTRFSPGCGNLGAAASSLAVCTVVYIRAG
jgi:hypothetical protein